MSTALACIPRYLAELDAIYRAGNATEHSYRPALKTLLEAAASGLTITNEPKHIECGAPDYIVTKGGIPLGYIEAKDIGTDLNGKANREQFERYKQSLGNLIITDYVTFQLFAEGEEVAMVTLANTNGGSINPDKQQFPAFLELIEQFTKYSGKTIYNSEQLAKMMAAKAKLLAEVITNALHKRGENDTLTGQYEGFKTVLLHNMEVSEFADMYAQTLGYGLFAARLNQTDSQPFTRYLAAQLIPQSNPFLRKFFNYIAGIELDSRITWIVDALADIFNCVAIDEIKKEFAKAEQDPYIHFYETFLAEYDPALRKSRGVYYTPVPAVEFIVGAVDDILKNEFDLKNGLADHSKVTRTIKNKDGKAEPVELHKVQILDPATGTGTFIAEVIDSIYERFSNNKGAWQDYCGSHLIPRLNAFEILMASYAMAHFKLDMKLKETGFVWNNSANSRLHVYLTNALEEAPEHVPELFMAQWLAKEAEDAGAVKRNAPVMVVIGNPPYNVSTQTKNEWIDTLIADYKKDLHEKKLNLDDDYIKFIRYGHYLVEKNGFGILAYISNNSFTDGITHRTMRKALLEGFDKIYILNLHGNSRKKETLPNNGKDENVFDIMQGVSINIFVKTGNKPEGDFAQVYYHDLYGKRESKYSFLQENSISHIKWEKLTLTDPYYFFAPKDFSGKSEYEKGFSVAELFTVFNSGIKTDRDSLFIDFDKNTVKSRMKKLLSGDFDDIFRERFNVKDSGSYKLTEIIRNKIFKDENIRAITYRPFDSRYIYYEPGITSRPAHLVMRNFYHGENFGLLFCRMLSSKTFSHIFVSSAFVESGGLSNLPSEFSYVFPLYLYPDNGALDATEKRRPNLNADIVNKIAGIIKLRFTQEKEDAENTFAPIDILDYIYAVLYSNNYRATYKEFLKIDFPRVPYPENAEQFCKLAALGGVLRNLHLMENVAPLMGVADFPVPGSNEVETLNYRGEKVYINGEQYFENVSPEVWAYYIGGYQSAQKWLKDRKGRKLSFEDVEHYQKIVAVLKTTIDLQGQVDAGLNV